EPADDDPPAVTDGDPAATNPDDIEPVPTTTEPATTPTTTVAIEPAPDLDTVAGFSDLARTSTVAVVAGSGGIVLDAFDGQSLVVTTEPMRRAVLGNERVWAQRSVPGELADADDTVLTFTRADAEPEVFELPNPTGGPLTLHDVTVVDEAVTVLYEVGPADCVPFTDDGSEPSCDGFLLAHRPATGETIEVASLFQFEDGWGRMYLAENGLIIGSSFASASAGVEFYSIGDGSLPTAAQLGLEEVYVDCAPTCPNGWGADRAGEHVGWVENGELVVAAIADGRTGRVALELAPGEADVHLDGVAIAEDGSMTGVAAVHVSRFDTESSGYLIDLSTGSWSEEPAASIEVD
ncbi:MAG: hypothetical protein AAFP84_13690, partial [Actinomycetota bacterium]